MDLKGLTWLEILKKIKNFITIEPLVICWLLPAIFNQVAMENLELEKVNSNRMSLRPAYARNTIIIVSVVSC